MSFDSLTGLMVRLLCLLQDISTPHMSTNNLQEFQEDESAQHESVFVLTDFDSDDYIYLYKREKRVVGPPVVLHCAEKQEVSSSV